MDRSPFPAPHGLSQGITSFIASCCQGIHQTPFSRLIRPSERRSVLPGPRLVRRVPSHRIRKSYMFSHTDLRRGPRSVYLTWTAPPVPHGPRLPEGRRIRPGCPPTCRHRGCWFRISLNDVNSSPWDGRRHPSCRRCPRRSHRIATGGQVHAACPDAPRASAARPCKPLRAARPGRPRVLVEPTGIEPVTS